MDVIHFGDIHIWRLGLVWSDLLYPKRILGPVNLLLNRRKKFPPGHAEAVSSEIEQHDADLVVFSGDITTQSDEHEFRRCAELFEPLHEKWKKHFFVIPGNHDRYTPKSVARNLYETYFPYSPINPATRIGTLVLEGGWVVVGFDCSQPFKFRSNGILRPEDANALEAELRKQAKANRKVILVGHFPYATPPEHPESWDHKLIHEEELARIVAEFKPAVYLHGHKHVRWLIRPDATPDTPCIDCGAAGMTSESANKQAGFVKFRLSDEGGLESVTGFVLQPDGTFSENDLMQGDPRDETS